MTLEAEDLGFKSYQSLFGHLAATRLTSSNLACAKTSLPSFSILLLLLLLLLDVQEVSHLTSQVGQQGENADTDIYHYLVVHTSSATPCILFEAASKIMQSRIYPTICSWELVKLLQNYKYKLRAIRIEHRLYDNCSYFDT